MDLEGKITTSLQKVAGGVGGLSMSRLGGMGFNSFFYFFLVVAVNL